MTNSLVPYESINRYGWAFGVITGLLAGGLSLGGTAWLQHQLLRAMLVRRGVAPWDYIRFLNYGVERVLLRRLGGGYVFVNRLLQEHLVSVRATADNSLYLLLFKYTQATT
jgi:hypothetical protein